MRNYHIDTKIIFGFLLWQLISVGLISTGVWPLTVIWLSLITFFVLIVYFSPKSALNLMILSIPFYVVLPNFFLEQFPMWRLVIPWLFVVVLLKLVLGQYKLNKLSFNWQDLKNKYRFLLPYEKWLGLFLIFIPVTAIWARYPTQTLKQWLFLINILLLYITARLVVATADNLISLTSVVRYSLLISVLLGFLQYILTFFASPYYFWQYWATMVSGTYYGVDLANVLTYSNSWFTANGAGQSLRMFGVLQDTHAFGVIVIMAIAFLLMKLDFVKATNLLQALFNQKLLWFVAVILSCFAVIASGTRGIWVAMLAPLGVAVLLLLWKKFTGFMQAHIFIYGLVVCLFVISPFISMGINIIRTINSDDNFLQRASSIYDLEESSNAGRLKIWLASFKYASGNPLGTGYGNFISSIATSNNEDLEQLENEENKTYNLPQKYVTAHNLYLHILVELGVVGLALFILFLGSFFKTIWLKLKLAPLQFKWLILCLGFAMIWILAYGFFDVTILNERVLMYSMLMLALIPGFVMNKSSKN